MTQCSVKITAGELLHGLIQLAKAAGVDSSMICKIETGKSQPSLRTLNRIAEALGTTPSALLSDTHEELAATAEIADET